MQKLALSLALLSISFTQAAAAPCVAPQVRSACCNYKIDDQFNNKPDVKYYAPDQFFASEADARAFVDKTYSKIAFINPFTQSNIVVVGGWNYANGNQHSGLDYWPKTVTNGQDVTFPIVAAAAGRVVTSKWDNWFGNTVIIEHTNGGEVYRTIYMHLRNGGHADQVLAQKIVPPNPNKNDNWTKYSKFSKKAFNVLYWGKDTDLVKVKAGDWVQAGQVIGTAGNTGAGGAGNGLDDNGNPTDAIRANNHLHFMLSVHPTNSQDWTFIDAFGVYGQANSGCYTVEKEPAYPRFFMPFYPSFFNLSQDVFSRFFYYWPAMGMGLQTLSVHASGNNVLASGAFDSHVNGAWYARSQMDMPTLTQWFNTYHAQGFRPRQLSVMVWGANPLFTVIWQKRNNEAYYFYPAMSDSEFQAKWNELVTQGGYHMEDYAAYVAGGVHRHAAIFVKDGNDGFYFFRNMDQAAYQAKFNELTGRGLVQTSINVENVGGQDRYAGIWRQMPGQWAAYVNMDAPAFQTRFNEFAGQGFRWYKVQGYNGSSRFGAVWVK